MIVWYAIWFFFNNVVVNVWLAVISPEEDVINVGSTVVISLADATVVNNFVGVETDSVVDETVSVVDETVSVVGEAVVGFIVVAVVLRLDSVEMKLNHDLCFISNHEMNIMTTTKVNVIINCFGIGIIHPLQYDEEWVRSLWE